MVRIQYSLFFDKRTNQGMRTFIMTSYNLNELLDFVHKSNLEKGSYFIENNLGEQIL